MLGRYQRGDMEDEEEKAKDVLSSAYQKRMNKRGIKQQQAEQQQAGQLDKAFWVADLNGYNKFEAKGKQI